MYFNKKNQFFHGIMFHHFHDSGIHTKGQGSISKDDFYNLIKFIGRKNILDSDVFFEKFKKKKLKKNEICFTFDDAIKCQIDIALPVLEDLKFKSFFFVYTSIFENNPNYLEIYRYFRMNYFNSVNDFYINFFKILNKDLNKFFKKNQAIINNYKVRAPFYSIEDIKFRVVRNNFFNKKGDYEKIMNLMMKEKNFIPNNYYSNLFFSKNDLILLDSLGHQIGIHSHNHSTLIENLSYNEQKLEYTKCKSIISKIIKKPKNEIKSMSHPCGSYNDDTLNVLNDLGIEIGFKHNMRIEPEKKMKKINNSFLEIARQDHAHIIKKINQ